MLGQVKIRYPVSKVLSYDVNIGKVRKYFYMLNTYVNLPHLSMSSTVR